MKNMIWVFNLIKKLNYSVNSQWRLQGGARGAMAPLGIALGPPVAPPVVNNLFLHFQQIMLVSECFCKPFYIGYSLHFSGSAACVVSRSHGVIFSKRRPRAQPLPDVPGSADARDWLQSREDVFLKNRNFTFKLSRRE